MARTAELAARKRYRLARQQRSKARNLYNDILRLHKLLIRKAEVYQARRTKLKESLQSARQVVDTATNILSAARQKTTQTKTAVRARLGTEYETKIANLYRDLNKRLADEDIDIARQELVNQTTAQLQALNQELNSRISSDPQILQAENQEKEAAQKLRDANKQEQILQTKFSWLEETVARLETKLQSVVTKLKDRKSMLDRAEDDLKAARKSLWDSKLVVRHHLEELVREAREKIHRLQWMRDQNNTKESHKKHRLNFVREKKEKLKQQLNELKAKFQEALEEFKTAERQFLEVKEKHSDLDKELNEMNQVLAKRLKQLQRYSRSMDTAAHS